MKLAGSCFSVLLLGILLISCGTSKEEKHHPDETRGANEQIVRSAPTSIPPNHCRVMATIESIEATLEGANEKDPCGNMPCLATVKIDSIVGYGSAFPKPLAAGQTLRVRFAFTLNATKDMLPDVKPALPGLSVGSRFEALIGGNLAMGKAEPVFTIYHYEKQ